MRCDGHGLPDPVKVIKRKQQTHTRLKAASIFNFDLTEVVLPQEEATSSGRRTRDDGSLTFDDHAGKRRIFAKQNVHFAFDAAGEALPPAAQRGAFRANVVQNAIRECKKERNIIVVRGHKERESNTATRVLKKKQ